MEQPDPASVREELARILASPAFDASLRNRAFLRHVVEEVLVGRANRIKAYAIATSVFGRGGDFDPQLDSIVRIEAGRLRRSLERYYLTEGQRTGLRIGIPRGSYVPTFEAQVTEAAPGPAVAVGPTRHGPSILVRPFEEEGDHRQYPNFTRGLVRQVIVGLTRYTSLFVYGAETAFSVRDHAVRHEADFLLTGGTSLAADGFTAELLLMDARDGRYVWGQRFERRLDPAGILQVRDEVAGAVVRAIAQPYGALFTEKARDMEGKPGSSLTAFDCVLRFYQYWRSYDRDMVVELREGLERAVAAEPGYADAAACLALLHVDAFRYGFPGGAGGLTAAMPLAQRAVQLAPLSSRSHHALGMVEWFAGDLMASLASFDLGLDLNPNDTDIMAELGLRLANLADWATAIPLIEASYARNPAQPPTYRMALFLWHLWHGRLSEALMQARAVNAPGIVFGHLAIAVAASGLDLHQEAASAVQAVLALDPGYGARAEADLAGRSIHPHLIALVMAGLARAGLPGVPRIACAS